MAWLLGAHAALRCARSVSVPRALLVDLCVVHTRPRVLSSPFARVYAHANSIRCGGSLPCGHSSDLTRCMSEHLHCINKLGPRGGMSLHALSVWQHVPCMCHRTQTPPRPTPLRSLVQPPMTPVAGAPTIAPSYAPLTQPYQETATPAHPWHRGRGPLQMTSYSLLQAFSCACVPVRYTAGAAKLATYEQLSMALPVDHA